MVGLRYHAEEACVCEREVPLQRRSITGILQACRDTALSEAVVSPVSG